MVDRVLDVIAPHICCSCGQENAILCDNCYFDIIDDPYCRCIVCSQPSTLSSLCGSCRGGLGATDVWVVSERYGAIKELVDRYKFERVRTAADVIAHLLSDRLPLLPRETIVCYIPDVPAHRRQRGYDHMQRVATLFAQRRSLDMRPLLTRCTFHSQRGLHRDKRLLMQKDAFIATSLPSDRPIVLLDDIYTTGGTLSAGVQALVAAGANEVYCGIVARQPLDDMTDL
jgi:predicted amidophosphoribosyltransferase